MADTTRDFTQLSDEHHENGYVICKTEKEYDMWIEFLYSMEQDFKVEFLESGKECKDIKVTTI